MLGIRVPRNPSRARIIAGMLATRARLSGKNADRITKLPLMEDDVKRAACEILINMLPPAYYTDAGFMAFLVLRMVRLVLRHGNTEASPMIFVTYAAILGSAGKDSDTAYAVALGAMKLLDGAAGGKYRSKVNHVFGMTVNHWKRHARESIDYSLRAYRLGRESGDFMYAAHSVNIMTMTRIMLGDNLDDIFTDYRKYEDFLKRTGDPFAMGNYSDNFQMYLNLKGLTESRRSLNSHGYDETRRLAEVRKTGNLMELFFHLLTRVKTLFLAGEFEECLALCEEMERIKRIPAGTLHTAEHCFYYSLALAACPGGPDRGRLRRMGKNRREMKRRAGACPDNFLHKLLLIDAEIARLSGDEAGTIRLYGMAIEAARSAGYLQNEAIAHERAALFFLEKGCRDIAGLYLELAFKCYLGWGADSKVYDLRERYATLRERPGSGAVSERRRQSDLSSLVDAEAMVKALLAISGEIVIDKLLEGLLTILLENAGAERCFLLLENEGRLTVAAEGEPGGEGFKVRQDLPAETHGGISMQVVNYAKRTLGAVVINDAGNDGLFRDDPVLRGRQVKSLLCVPLVRSKNITGMIYLENSLTAHAFPPGKTEMVRLLSAQAAIALENAILYEKARNAEQESYNQCQEIQGQYEELEAMYEEMESMNQELARTSKDLMDANDSLARSQERYRLLAENLTDVIWTTDTNLRFTYISPSIERLAGYTPEEFLSLGLEEMMTPESLVLVTETIAGEMERNRDRGGDPGRSRIVELEQKRKDGSTVWIEVKASFLFDERGSPSMVLGVSRDITERRKALEKIRNTKNYLDGVLNSLPSMLIAVDAGGYILQWNSACEESLGIRRQDAVMTLLWETVPFMETYRDIVSGVIEHAKPVELHRESVFLREEKFFDIAMYPLSLAESGGAVVRIDDVTGRVRIEQVMVQTEKMLSLGGLAAGMAHEINNPLGGIMLGAQNILRRLSGDLDKNREAAAELGITMEQLAGYHEKRGVLKLLEGIVSLGGRASQIVMNMLNFSRHSSVEKTPVDLAELLDQTIELASHDYDLKKKYDFRHITIVREFAPDLPPVPCNRTEIEQVLLNLLKNSAQAMRENRGEGYEPLINLRLYRKDGHALIEVQDNGPGMDLKTRRRIFEPFFTTKDVGVGTGLGLSVSYYIITSNHRGAISVESEPGKGATFRISLPVCPEEKER
jgi:PAS domain S-box-containing protein